MPETVICHSCHRTVLKAEASPDGGLWLCDVCKHQAMAERVEVEWPGEDAGPYVKETEEGALE